MDQNEVNKVAACENCQKAASLIQVILDDEATSEQKSFFSLHLDSCKDCLAHYLKEKDLLDVIKQKLERKCCPNELLKKIKALVLNSND